MIKINRKTIFTIIGILLLIVVIALIGKTKPFAVAPEGIVCNYVPLSIDRVSVSTQPHLPGKEVYVLYLADRSGSRCVRGSYQVDKKDIESSIESSTRQDVTVDYNLWIGIENVKNIAEYKRGSLISNIPFYKRYDLGVTYSGGKCEENAKNKCRGNLIGFSYLGLSCNAVCQTNIGNIYELKAPDVSYKADVTVKGRESITKTIGSITSDIDTEQQFGNDAYIIWSGGLMSGYITPSETARKLMLSSTKGDKIVIENIVSSLNDVKFNIRNCLNRCMSGIVCTNSELDSCNSESNRLVDSYTVFSPWYNAKVEGTSVKMDLSNRPPAYGTFYIEVDADWLGIYVAMTNPDIKDCTNFDVYYTGKDSNINYNVYNKGSDGNIRVKLACDTGLTPGTLQNEHYVKSQATASGSFKISQSENMDKTYKCTLTASSTGAIGVSPKVDTCAVSGTGHAKKECYQRNKWVCIGDYKAFCNLNYKIENKEYCQYGCEETTIGAECISEGCKKDVDCPKTIPFCVNKRCVECKKDVDCPKEKPKCEKNTCVTAPPPPPEDCPSCFSWLYSVFKPNHCKAKDLFTLKLFGITLVSAINQKTVCPTYLSIIGLISALFVLIIVLIIKKVRRK